ncbi:helix-turn-helix domain-containing protein [Flavobacteriaceae sp. LMIT009]
MEQVFISLTLAELEPIFKSWVREACENLNFKIDNQTEIEKFLDINEASAFLNLAVSTIYSKVSKKELPYMKRGKRLYFSKTELLDYIKGGRKQTVSEIETEVHSYLKMGGGKNA